MKPEENHVGTDTENHDNIMNEPIITLTQSQSPIITSISQTLMNTIVLVQTPLVFHEATTTTPTLVSNVPVTSSPLQTPIEPFIPDVNIEDHLSDDNEGFLVQDDEVEINGEFQLFVEPVLAASLLDDRSDLDDEVVVAPAKRKDYQMLNTKLNALIRRAYSSNSTTFQSLMTDHENKMKAILEDCTKVFQSQSLLVNETTKKVQRALFEVEQPNFSNKFF